MTDTLRITKSPLALRSGGSGAGQATSAASNAAVPSTSTDETIATRFRKRSIGRSLDSILAGSAGSGMRFGHLERVAPVCSLFAPGASAKILFAPRVSPWIV